MSAQGMFPGWKVVIGSGCGIAFGSAVFIGSSFALLAVAIGSQFGWSQTDLAKGASIFLLLQMLTYPIVGWFLDRFGSRKVAMASITLFALSLVALTQISSAQWQFYAGFVLIGLVSAGTNVVSYARAITHWFDRKRGLALGVAAGCQAVGAFVMPLAFQKLVTISGWQTAIFALAALEVVICLPLVAFLVKDDPHPLGLHPDGDVADHAAPVVAEGPTVGEIVRTGTFWKLAVAFAIMGMSFYALTTNVAFILTKSAGLTLPQVATIQAITGVAVLFGRVGFGYLLDKFSAASVGLLALALSAIYFAAYGVGTNFAFIAVAALIGGASVGGESDLMPYLAGRYFGKQSVSKIFGWFLSAYVLGAAIGPVAFAKATEAYGGASVPLYALAALQIVPAILFLLLGPYPANPKRAA